VKCFAAPVAQLDRASGYKKKSSNPTKSFLWRRLSAIRSRVEPLRLSQPLSQVLPPDFLRPRTAQGRGAGLEPGGQDHDSGGRIRL